MPAATRVLAYVAAVGAGGCAGVLGSFCFAYTAASWPVGEAVALGLTAAVLVTAGLATGSRAAAALAAAAWLVAVAPLSAQRPEGDLVVPATAYGYVWLFGGLLVATVSVALPYAALASGTRRARR